MFKMSNEDCFEEINLENINIKVDIDEDDISEMTNFTNVKEKKKENIQLNQNENNYISEQKPTNYIPIKNETNIENKIENSDKKESKFYYEFMEMNKEFFERIGFKDITNDPIFNLTEEVEINKNANTNICLTCKKEISRIFTKNKSCKFCGCVLCDKCSSLKRQIPNSERLSVICSTCNNKFINFQLHQEFKEKLTNKEFEISEFNQKLEKFSLIYSEQLDDINKSNEIILKKKRENETKEEILITETKNIKRRTEEVSDSSGRQTIKINESINILRSLDEKKKNLEKDFASIQKDRENLTFEYERKQNYLDEVLGRINQLSVSIKNHQQSQQQRRETGNKKLDLLIKEKMKSQRKTLEETNHTETTIIMNPSKIIKEVYKEPLLSKSTIEVSKDGILKRFVMYLGNKIYN